MVKKMLEKKSIAFFAKFFGIFFIGQTAIGFFPLAFIQESIASLQSKLLSVPAAGNIVFANGANFVINEYCIGTLSSIMLLAIIFSLKKPDTKTKLLMWAAGTIVLFIANIFRVYFVLLSAIWFNPKVAEAVHVASWLFVSALIIFVWYTLTKKMVGTKRFHELI